MTTQRIRISQDTPKILNANHLGIYNILDSLATVDKILSDKISVARFGDGELLLTYQAPIIFQDAAPNLTNELQEILVNKETLYSDYNLKVAIPYPLIDTSHLNTFEKNFWSKLVRSLEPQIKHAFQTTSYTYLDSTFSRVVTLLEDHILINTILSKTISIWENRDVILIEGAETFFGVDNNLFKGAKSINRIIAPKENAYSTIDQLEKCAKKLSKKLVDPIILIALGPTATVLAVRLAKQNLQTIDIGHFDLQYEFLRKGSYEKISIPTRSNYELQENADSTLLDLTLYKQQIFANFS